MKRSTTVGAFDAKNKLSALLDRVELGETVVITRHGEPIAKLVPFAIALDSDHVQRTIDALRKARKGVRLGGLSLKKLIEEGRA